jgi:hypothetical protein
VRLLSFTLVLLLTTDARGDAIDDVIATGTAIARDSCSSRVLGQPFRGAEMICLSVTSIALTSIAVEDPSRTAVIAPLLDRLVTHALARRARAPFPATSVLYRGLLGMMLVARHRLGSEDTARMDALAAGLARDVERGWVASYRDGIWPCDHAPALAFLRLHGSLRGDPASTRAANALRDRLAMLVPVFPTRVGADGSVLDGNMRTTALAFTAAYLLPAEPDLARAFATQVITNCERATIAACREWRSPGHRADAASGPMVEDFSAGATALAMIATRAFADRTWNTTLLSTAILAGANRLPRRSLERSLFRWAQVGRAW